MLREHFSAAKVTAYVWAIVLSPATEFNYSGVQRWWTDS